MEEARREHLLRIYAQTRTFAVVGVSADASEQMSSPKKVSQDHLLDTLLCRPKGNPILLSVRQANW